MLRYTKTQGQHLADLFSPTLAKYQVVNNSATRNCWAWQVQIAVLTGESNGYIKYIYIQLGPGQLLVCQSIP
jgi:hypothetical protein